MGAWPLADQKRDGLGGSWKKADVNAHSWTGHSQLSLQKRCLYEQVPGCKKPIFPWSCLLEVPCEYLSLWQSAKPLHWSLTAAGVAFADIQSPVILLLSLVCNGRYHYWEVWKNQRASGPDEKFLMCLLWVVTEHCEFGHRFCWAESRS